MGDMVLDAELDVRARAGSLGPCSTSPFSLLEPIQLEKMLVMVGLSEARRASQPGSSELNGPNIRPSGRQQWGHVGRPRRWENETRAE